MGQRSGARLGAMVAGVALVITAASTAVYVNAQDDAEVIAACVSTSGTVRVMDDGASCRRNETPLTWNRTGPAGPRGPMGPRGPEAGEPDPNPLGLEMSLSLSASGTSLAEGVTVQSYRWQIDNPVATAIGGQTGASKPSFEPFEMSIGIDQRTPALFAATAAGRVVTGTLDICSTGEATPCAQRFEFTSASVTSVEYASGPQGRTVDLALDVRQASWTIGAEGEARTLEMDRGTSSYSLLGRPPATVASDDGPTMTYGEVVHPAESLASGISGPSAGAISGGGAGKASFDPIVITTWTDPGTLTIARDLLAGVPVTNAGYDDGAFEVALTDVRVTSLVVDSTQVATVGFDYRVIDWTVGDTTTGWDLALNEPS